MTVLVVDDTAILRSIIKDILVEFCGVSRNDIVEAADGRKAVTEYKRTKPDIIFLDIAMPNLCGVEAVKRIIEIDPDAKIIMCTGKGERESVKECVYAGAQDYLLKPIIPHRLVAAVEKIMGPLNVAEDHIPNIQPKDDDPDGEDPYAIKNKRDTDRD